MDTKLQTIRELIEMKSLWKADAKTHRALLSQLKSRLVYTDEPDYLRETYLNLSRSYNCICQALDLTTARLETFLTVNETMETKDATAILSRMVAEKIITQDEAHRVIRDVIEKRISMEAFVQKIAEQPRKPYHPSQGDGYHQRCDASLTELRVFIWTYSQMKESANNDVAELLSRLRMCNLASVNIMADRYDSI